MQAPGATVPASLPLPLPAPVSPLSGCLSSCSRSRKEQTFPWSQPRRGRLQLESNSESGPGLSLSCECEDRKEIFCSHKISGKKKKSFVGREEAKQLALVKGMNNTWKWSDLEREGLGVNSNILVAFSSIFLHPRANQVLVVGLRTWDGSLAFGDRMGGSKWTQDVSRLWVKTVQWLQPGPWFWRPNMTSNELDGFLILEG